MNAGSSRNFILSHRRFFQIGSKFLGVIFILTAFSAAALGAEITVSQVSFGPNTDIVLTYSGAPGNAQDWIGFYQVGAPNGNYLTYQYLNGSQNGTLVFTSPELAGDYNFRMFENNGYALLATSPTIAVSFPAEVDLSFGTNGWVRFDFLGNEKSDWICAIAVLKNGKIIAAGTAKTGLTDPGGGNERNEIALARFDADGKLDGTFGEGGKVHTEITNRYYFPLNYASASAMAVQSDGKIIVGGSTENNFLLVRYTADGIIDETFGYNGIVLTDMRYSEEDPISFDELRCLALQNDGKILAGGASIIDAPYSPGNLAIARYNADGSPDMSFNGLGKLWKSYEDITGHFRWAVNSIAVEPDGHILAGITAASQFANNYLAIARYKPDASLDSTFGSDGILWETRPGKQNDQRMTAIALAEPSKRILALGYDFGEWFVMRYWWEGFIDSTFGTAGQTVSDLSAAADVPAGMIPLPREITLVGVSFDTFYGLSVDGTFGLVRYDAAGRLDPDFGKVRFPLMEDNVKLGNQLMAFAMQDTDAVILAGFTETGQQVWDFTLTRILLKPLATGTEPVPEELQPTSFHLAQNYPNPFNPMTKIVFDLPEASDVKLKVYDLLGQVVDVLIDSHLNAGYHKVSWNGQNVASGIYFYQLTVGRFADTRSMLLLK